MASRKKQATTVENLPHDILSNILCRLPGKQRVQMKCMSKFWYNFLSQPLKDDNIFMVFYGRFSFKSISFSPHSISRSSPNPELTNLIKLPANKPSDEEWCNVVGSVNGLICFYYFGDHSIVINIWNPFLSKLLVLPPSSNIPVASYAYDIVLAFGFDLSTNDYKVVKLKFHSRREPKECLRVEVYSMRKGSWKLITEKFPSHVTGIYDGDEVCVHGHQSRVHWLGDLGERKKQTIVAFDFDLETFSEILLPDSLLHDIENASVVLGYKDKKICVMSHAKDNECVVWVMHKYGVAESWIKHRVCSEFTGNYLNPFDDDFLNKAYDHSRLLYKPIVSNHGFLKIMAILLGKTRVIRYVESLGWVRT